jgi:hypothetical protein
VSRIGIIGQVGPARFAENVDDALQRLGHVVTSPGPCSEPTTRSSSTWTVSSRPAWRPGSTAVRGDRLRRRGAHRFLLHRSELFGVGKETVVYHHFDDLFEQAARLLSERRLTERFGDAAA